LLKNRADGGAGIRFLTRSITSPTLIAQFKTNFTELSGEIIPIRSQSIPTNQMAGAKMAFGSYRLQVDQADRFYRSTKIFFRILMFTRKITQKRQLRRRQQQINLFAALETTMALSGR